MSQDSMYQGILPDPSQANGFLPQPGKKVRFLLGTDIHIGEPDTCEQRVAITPEQCQLLGTWMTSLGIEFEAQVVSNAGKAAGYEDAAFEAAGARIVSEAELPSLSAPHLVHALKEPTEYEATVPGPYMRIGALHSGDFKPESGLAEVLRVGNYNAIFDGSAVGGFASATGFPIRPKFRIPLRSSMSVYAGKLAGGDVGERLHQDEKVIVSGGGVVGTSAVGVLLDRHLDKLREILIIERSAVRCSQLRDEYAAYPVVRIVEGTQIDDDELEDCKGLILTIFIQGSGATPRVVDVKKLALMCQKGAIVDVAIDEGGGIDTRHHNQGRIVTAAEVRAEIDLLGKDLWYEADNHMPRRRPREASIEHGNTSLMYLAALLYLCASEGDNQGALRYILDQDYIAAPGNILDALVLDLKHGLAFTKAGNCTVLYRQALKKSDEISAFLAAKGITPIHA